MNEKISQLAEELKCCIHNDEDVVTLNELEKKMNESEEVMKLAYVKDTAASQYSYVLNHFADDSKEAIAARKQLSEAKANLDNHPLVASYLKQLVKVQTLYYQINDLLFSSLNSKMCESEEKK